MSRRSDPQGRQPAQVSLLGNLSLAWRYVWNESLKQKKNFFIGFTAVWLVVFSIALLQNTVTLAPILFLIIGETSTGEMDILMNPAGQGFLNYTDVSSKLHGAPNLVGVAPRWVSFALLSKTESYDRNSSTIALVVDSMQEQKIGLGRRWKYPVLSGRQCHITGSLMRFLEMNSGDNVTISIDTVEMMASAAGYGSNVTEFVVETLRSLVSEDPNDLQEDLPSPVRLLLPPGLSPRAIRIILSLLGIDVDGILDGSVPIDVLALKRSFTTRQWFTLLDGISDPAGKYPSSLGNIVMLEKDAVQEIFRHSIEELRNGNFKAIFPHLELSPQAQEMLEYFLYIANDPSAIPTPSSIPIPPDTEIPLNPEFPERPPVALPPRPDLPRPNETSWNDTRPFYMDDYALLIVGMNSERYERYSGSKNALDAAWLKWTNSITMALGLDFQISLTTPLGKMLGVLYYLRLVLDQMLLIVELFLVGLGCYLIYSLLLSDVEAKVYESGMLRALGMQQRTLVALLSLQSLLFSIPGLSVGLLVAFIVWQPIRWALVHFMATPTPIMLHSTPVIIGVVVGLIMPLLALIGPVMKSLSKTLRDSLDLYHSATNDTLVMVTKLENLGLSPGQTWGALLMVVFGFVVYYLAPLSFIFLNLPLFFTIFVAVLAGMLIGLCMLAMLFHTRIQLLVMHAIMWAWPGDSRSLKPLVRKNLHGHGARNSKTAILFTTCVAFIIFAGSIFQLQTNNITATVQITVGSDLVVATFTSNTANKIDEHGLTSYLERMKAVPNSPILDFAFSTFSLNDETHVGFTRVGNLAEMPTRNTLIYGVTSNFMNAVFDKYTLVTEKDAHVQYKNSRSGKYDVIESLYSTPEIVGRFGENVEVPPVVGSLFDRPVEAKLSNEFIYNHTIPVIISKAITTPLSVDTASPIIALSYPIGEKVGRHLTFNQVYTLGQPRAVLSKLPGFFFSSYKQTASVAPLLVSMDSYEMLRKTTHQHSYLANDTLSEDIPKRALFVRLKDSTDEQTRELIGNGLRNYVTNDLVQVLDAQKLVVAISSAVWVLYIFSNIVAVLVQILCFFTLLVSFTSNINENSWEFGVLRAIGLSAFQVIRLYIYEASCIIISSVILGSSVGLLVAITLTLQADLFSELPFRMEFPVFLFSSLVVMSTITALLSSYIPARALGAKKIASVLKGK
jgi:ABC-type antimicrobial peptide transport system permease subunit